MITEWICKVGTTIMSDHEILYGDRAFEFWIFAPVTMKIMWWPWNVLW